MLYTSGKHSDFMHTTQYEALGLLFWTNQCHKKSDQHHQHASTGLPQPIAKYNLTGQAGESWINAPKVEHTLKEPLLALPMAVLRPCTMTMSSSGEHAAAADALAPHWLLDTSRLRPTAQLWAGVRWPNITLTLCIVESPSKIHPSSTQSSTEGS